MAHVIKQLGQLRPAAATPTSIYSPAANTETLVHNVIVCNTSASSAKYSIFADDNGTTYDESTALAFEIVLAAKTTELFEVKICMDDSTGNLAVESDITDAITFTANGQEFS